jgi:hypothetical protein
MVPKSGYRFSDQTMLNNKARACAARQRDRCRLRDGQMAVRPRTPKGPMAMAGSQDAVSARTAREQHLAVLLMAFARSAKPMKENPYVQ